MVTPNTLAVGYDVFRAPSRTAAVARRAKAARDARVRTVFQVFQGRDIRPVINARITDALSKDLPARAVLVGFAVSLLEQLLGPASVALNRAASYWARPLQTIYVPAPNRPSTTS